MTHPSTDSTDPTTARVVRRLDEVTAALEAITDLLDHHDELSQGLQRVCQQVVRAVPGAAAATVVLMRDGVASTAATTGGPAAEVDHAQHRAGEGPGIDAALTGRVIRVPYGEVGERWPQFSVAAAELGIRSFLSAPVFVHAEFHGSLNLYSREPDGFDVLDAAVFELYTTAAEAALRGVHRARQAHAEAAHPGQALDGNGTKPHRSRGETTWSK